MYKFEKDHSGWFLVLAIVFIFFGIKEFTKPVPEEKLLPRDTSEKNQAEQYGRDMVCMNNLLRFVEHANFRQVRIDFIREDLFFSCYYSKKDKGAGEATFTLETKKPEQELFAPSIRAFIEILKNNKSYLLPLNINKSGSTIRQTTLLTRELTQEDMEQIFNKAMEYWEFSNWGFD